MTKKERVLAALKGQMPDHVPAGFSLHFPKESNAGEAGIQAHLDFFRETDTDIIKIMNENLVPHQGTIKTPEDWKCIGTITRESPFIQRQLEFTKEILDRSEPDTYSLGTLHGITASTIHPIEGDYGYDPVRTLLTQHLRENSTPVLDAMKRIAEGMCELARGYAQAGVDGIYYASLGAEYRWFTDEEFAQWIAPFDKLILSEIQKTGCAAFLHICKDGLNMNRYEGYADYCDAVNWGVYEAPCSLEEGKSLFPGKTVMGGLANHTGPLVEGTKEELEEAVKALVSSAGAAGFIVGADCTLPTTIPYERIRWVSDYLKKIPASQF